MTAPSERSRTQSSHIPDVIREGLAALFVGINPDPLSARVRHHFANPANAFWRLLGESGCTSRRLAPTEEQLLLEDDLGITNLIERSTPGVADLRREDIERGRVSLRRKLGRYRPRLLVFVGITGYRMFSTKSGPIRCGEQPERIEGARVFVLPHPSGRNAHFRYGEMLDYWREVADAIQGDGRDHR